MISFRPANHEDINLLFRWSNDELTRKNSFNDKQIEFETHRLWFEKRINNKQYLILLPHYQGFIQLLKMPNLLCQ